MLDLRLSNAHGGRCIPRVIEGGTALPRGVWTTWLRSTILLSKLRNLTSLTSVQYAPRGGVLTEGAREYAPREGASFSNYRLPSSGCPPQKRGAGAQTHKNTHKGVVCRCARCAQLCAFFGAKTHVVCGGLARLRRIESLGRIRRLRRARKREITASIARERASKGAREREKPPPPQREKEFRKAREKERNHRLHSAGQARNTCHVRALPS